MRSGVEREAEKPKKGKVQASKVDYLKHRSAKVILDDEHSRSTIDLVQGFYLPRNPPRDA